MSYGSYSDDEDQGHRNWISDIAEAKHKCRELLEMSERAFTDPHRCLAVGLGSDQAELLRQQHSAVMNYYEELAPFHEQLWGAGDGERDQWTKELVEIRVPAKESHVELEQQVPHNKRLADYIGPGWFYHEDADEEKEVVRLETLDEWQMRVASVSVDAIKQFYGPVSETITRRVWLPPVAARKCYRLLNSSVEDLGFAAQVKEVELDGEPWQPHQ